MNSIILAIFTFFLYIIAYNTYGKFIAKKLFKLDNTNKTPAVEQDDGIDYVPTRKEIIFGHHFTSIAGLGPIVGPAIAIIWGWIPALLWLVFGSIFMGAVHDFGSLIVSLRNRGVSIGELTSSIINQRARVLFFLIIFFELWIVIAIFAMIMGVLFNLYPESVFPVWFQIPIAIGVGVLVYRRKMNVTLLSIIAIIFMYITIIVGAHFPIKIPSLGHVGSVEIWVLILLIYVFFASTLPVWVLLQPRDYINAFQLIIAMTLLFWGVLFAHPQIVAPGINTPPADAPPILPFIFVIVACGAISGFHSLVSSGTSSKQILKESDSLFVGYGGMLFESFLAILVLISVSAGIGIKYITKSGEVLHGFQAWQTHYSSYLGSSGLGAKLTAFITGSANLMEALKIPHIVAATIMGVFIVSFAGTTLDTATRVQRYVITEFLSGAKWEWVKNRYFTTFIAVLTAALLAFSQKGGKGAMILWPLFGTVNQLLAGLALLIITVYLKKHKKNLLISGIPMVFMITMTGYAMIKNIINFFLKHNHLLFGIGIAVFLLELWLIIEGIIVLKGGNNLVWEKEK